MVYPQCNAVQCSKSEGIMQFVWRFGDETSQKDGGKQKVKIFD